MKNSHRHIGVYLFEVFLFLVCTVGIVAFFRTRSNLLDILLLALWVGVLLILMPLLIHGEIKLRHVEVTSEPIIDADVKDGK